MDKSAVYHKTEKGQNEIATRAFKLPARARSMLILVDGKSSGQQIVDQARHFGDAEQYFDKLVSEGFIEPVAVTGAAPRAAAMAPTRDAPPLAAPPPPAATPAAAAPGVMLAAVVATKAFSTRYFIDSFGPDGEMFALKIEKTKTAEELVGVLEKLREILRQMRGNEKADRFWKQVQALMSGER